MYLKIKWFFIFKWWFIKDLALAFCQIYDYCLPYWFPGHRFCHGVAQAEVDRRIHFEKMFEYRKTHPLELSDEERYSDRLTFGRGFFDPDPEDNTRH